MLETLTCAITMQLVTILKGVTPALATLDIQAAGYLAQVSVSISNYITKHVSSTTLQYIILFLLTNFQ